MSKYYSEWYENFIGTIGLLDDDELYSAYRSMLLTSQNTFALNRKVMEKTIDSNWVETIENGLVYVDNVMRNPRKTIENVEEVVPIALSKKITVDSIKHLAQHTDLIQSIDPVTGKITPSKILNVHKEESLLTYENKFVNTLIDRLFIFVNRRYDKLKAVTHDEQVFSMEYNSDVETDSGKKMNLTLKIETTDSLEIKGAGGSTLWQRVEKIKQIIESYKGSPFCQEMGQAYIRPPVMRTNAIMKNVDLKACLKLWQFIESYDKVGYEINISDTAQNPDSTYIQDLYSLTALNYLLFRSFTSENSEELVELKTKKNKTVTPKILRKFDNDNPNAYDVALGVKLVSDESESTEEVSSDENLILAEIDKIIEIEQQYIYDEEFREEEEKRIAEEKERQRIEKERLEREKAEREERERLAKIEAERLEAERLERERVEREERERLAKIEAERLEAERIERERIAELERIENERLEAERLERERIEREEREKQDAIEREQKAKLEEERIQREKRDEARAEKLKSMRTEIEKSSFEEIYPEYSKNPIHIIRRNTLRAVSLIRKDGKILREGDTTEPILAERIALQAKLKRQLEIEKQRQEEMNILYEKYIPNPIQKHKQNVAFKKRMKNRVYNKPIAPIVQRTSEEQMIIDAQMKQLFKTYHVSLFEKTKRRFEELRRKIKHY